MNRFRITLALAIIGSIVVGRHQTDSLEAQEINPIEAYVLNRDEVSLDDLFVTGSQEHFYYRCLDLQHHKRLEQVDQLLIEWIKKFGRDDKVREIEHRQSLLRFPTEPEKAAKYWKRHFELKFNHSKKTADADRKLPQTFDNEKISIEKLTLNAVLSNRNSVEGIQGSGLYFLDRASLNKNQLRSLLQKLEKPDLPNLVDLLVLDFANQKQVRFGQIEIHNRLTLQQLDDLAAKLPEVLNQQSFVHQYLLRLAPNADQDIRRDAKTKREYLTRVLEFTEQLNEVQNSLRANVLHRLLVLDKAEGIFDRDRFLKYLALPRQAAFIRADYRKRFSSNTEAYVDFSLGYPRTIIRPISNDQEIVRYFLGHYLAESDDLSDFQEWVESEYLLKLQAEVNLLNGTGSVEEWAKVLGPEATAALTKRVDLEFAATTPKIWNPGEPVELKIETKNVPQLVMNVFQINAENYYRQFESEIGTDLKLDGLVPTEQKVFQYDENPILRKQRLFKLDFITEPGVYVVDLIGNGVNSRALLRIGHLNVFVNETIAGHSIRVVDQSGQLVPDASIWFSGDTYKPEGGRLLIPYSNSPGKKKFVVSANGLASLGTLDLKAEDYRLEAGIHVDREMLLQHRTASVVVRPSVQLNGNTVTNKILKNVEISLTISGTNFQTNTVSRPAEIDNNGDFVAEFTVPEMADCVKVEFSVEVEQQSTHKTIQLKENSEFRFNSINKLDQTEQLLLVPSAEGYYLEFRGKSGEPIPNRAIKFSFKHNFFVDHIDTELLTDDSGKVALGPLAGIERVFAGASRLAAHEWFLNQKYQTIPAVVHSMPEVPISVPYTLSTTNRNVDQQPDDENAEATNFEVTPAEFALFEQRGDVNVRDALDHVKLQPGRLLIENLPEGDYLLSLKATGQEMKIRVCDGQLEQGLIIGSNRILESQILNRLSVSEVSRVGDQLKIQLNGHIPTTRVHIFASRFHPTFNAGQDLRIHHPHSPSNWTPGLPNSSYIEGRDIGEELRYILDRQLARKFAGNMLPRPSLLLNPWKLRDTENQNQSAADGEALKRQQELLDAAKGGIAVPSMGQMSLDHDADGTSLDFLLKAGITLTNLHPDESGLITVPMEELKGLQYIRVVAVDHQDTVATDLALPADKMDTRDLRMANGLDPTDHFSQKKTTEVLKQGEQFSAAMSEDPKVTVYGSTADLFDFLKARFSRSRFDKFSFLKNWSALSTEEKQQKYSEFACHELHFFLYRKDQAFFNKVVLPILENKFEKTFLDKWFLELPLDEYLQHWQFEKLNAFEKILLAQRRNDERAKILKSVTDTVAAIPLDRQKMDSNFDKALDGLLNDEYKDRSFQFGGSLSSAPAAVMAAPSGAYAEEPLEEFQGKNTASFGIPAPSRPDSDRSPQKRMRKRSGRSLEDLDKLHEKLVEEDYKERGIDFDGDLFDAVSLGDVPARRFYRAMLPTSEWIESNYYRRNPESELAENRCKSNLFWQDYARHIDSDQTSFLSPNFMHIKGDITELLLVLALMDLPESTPEHKIKQDEKDWQITAASDVLLLTRKLVPTQQQPTNSVVLLSENFFRLDDRHYLENGNRYDKFVIDEFLPQVVYGAQLVVTNPTSAPRQVELLMQIPNGSLPVGGGSKTKMVPVILGPFESMNFEYKFYFPKTGTFTHYPAHVAQGESVLAAAAQQEFKVVPTLTESDTTSWNILSQDGTDDEVIQYLENENLNEIDLFKIAFRMKDRDFFARTIATLRSRQVYSEVLWSYGIEHLDRAAAAEYLQHNKRFTKELGHYFASDWFTFDITKTDQYQHREYWPLINSRFHQLGARRKLLNSSVHTQYSKLLDLLVHKETITAEDRLVLTYFLVLQDRIEEAMVMYDSISSDEIKSKLQLDYLTAYLAIYRDDLETTKRIANKYLDHPIQRWRQRFRSMVVQVAQAEGISLDVTENELAENFDDEKLFGEHVDQSEVASQLPTFQFQLDNQQVQLTYRNLSQISINYYVIDLEQLFSQRPFTTQQNLNIGWVKPNQSQQQALDDSGNLNVEIPAELANKNLLIQLTAGQRSQTASYFSQSMNVQIAETHGQLQVRDTEGKALPKTYIKVYGKKSGKAVFLKDGYTDFRGRFDYVSQSNVGLDGIEEIAILVANEQTGAQIKVVKPPQQ